MKNIKKIVDGKMLGLKSLLPCGPKILVAVL